MKRKSYPDDLTGRFSSLDSNCYPNLPLKSSMETFAIVTYAISSKILEILEISDDHQAHVSGHFEVTVEEFCCNEQRLRV